MRAILLALAGLGLEAPQSFAQTGWWFPANPLSHIVVRDQPLRQEVGLGQDFDHDKRVKYLKLKAKALSDPTFPLQWSFRNLDTGLTLSQSSGHDRNFYGASVTKIFVAGAFLQSRQARITLSEAKLIGKLIAVSDNDAWARLQTLSGAGQSVRGMEVVQQFVEELGLERTHAYRGWLHGKHGNETNAKDLVHFAELTYRGAYPGAGILWRFLATCRTGGLKGAYHLPQWLAVGGKTGTYHGPTLHAEKRKPYQAMVHHHLLTFRHLESTYAMAILSDRGRDEDVQLIAGGLFDEWIEPLADSQLGLKEAP